MRLYKILKKQLITEKGANAQMQNNTYLCEVSKDATKIDIKKAVLELYGVAVARVNTLTTREKFKFGRKGIQRRKGETKKAYITLKDQGATLDFTLIK